MPITRRFLLKASGLALFSTGTAPSFLQRAAAVTRGNRRKVLVTIFQRGAMDGLNAVIPYGDEDYYRFRPTLAIPRPGKGEEAALDLDRRFGLHPSLAALRPFWKDSSLAVIQAAGSPDATRSHFDAQDFMESATPGDKGTPDGWLNRYLQAHQRDDATPLRAVSMGPKLPRSLQGFAPAVAINRLNDFRLPGRTSVIEEAFSSMYAADASNDEAQALLSRVSGETVEAMELVKDLQRTPYRPAQGARYPRGRFGDSLKQIAQMIKADVGVEVAFAEMGGWDTHAQQAPRLTALMRQFSAALAAFAEDLGSRMQEVVLLTMSEFGRTARENGNRGTDHGHANAMFVLGGGVKGGAVYGEWPGLEPDQLFEGRDLALTTDFRDVFAEVLRAHLDTPQLGPVFPGYQPDPRRFRGFLKT